ncbi:hypothetical protein ES703_27118 [subsurface metagenome]
MPDNAMVTVRLQHAGEFVLCPFAVKPGEDLEITLHVPNMKSLKGIWLEARRYDAQK